MGNEPSIEEQKKELDEIFKQIEERKKIQAERHREIRRQMEINSRERCQYFRNLSLQSNLNYANYQKKKINDLSHELDGLDLDMEGIETKMGYLQQTNDLIKDIYDKYY